MSRSKTREKKGTWHLKRNRRRHTAKFYKKKGLGKLAKKRGWQKTRWPRINKEHTTIQYFSKNLFQESHTKIAQQIKPLEVDEKFNTKLFWYSLVRKISTKCQPIVNKILKHPQTDN